MEQVLQIVMILSAIYSGNCAICLSMDKHIDNVAIRYKDIVNKKILFSIGWLLILLSIVLALFLLDVSIGVIVWLGSFTLIQLLVVATLNYTSFSFITLCMSLLVFLCVMPFALII